MIENIKEGVEVGPLRTKRYTMDGRIIDVLLTATKLFDLYGKFSGVVTTEHDITEIQNVEKKYKSEIDDLKRKIEEITKKN